MTDFPHEPRDWNGRRYCLADGAVWPCPRSTEPRPERVLNADLKPLHEQLLEYLALDVTAYRMSIRDKIKELAAVISELERLEHRTSMPTTVVPYVPQERKESVEVAGTGSKSGGRAHHVGIRSDAIKKLVRAAHDQGFTIREKGSGHLSIEAPNGGIVIVSKTQDGSGPHWRRDRSRLQRIGLDVSKL